MKQTKEKIGVALITCDRPQFYKKSVNSVLNAVQEIDLEYVVVNDGTERLPFYPINFIETEGKRGVSIAKNLGIKFLLENGCDHVFLMEDDVLIKDVNVFSEYIRIAKATGILHLNYALHGNHNKDHSGNFVKRKTINYPNNVQVDLYENILGAFSYYHRKVLDSVGLMDEGYYNAMEHVCHTYQIIKAGYHPPFRWFADINNSEKYLEDIVPDHNDSKIRSESNFREVFQKGLDRFIQKNGFSVVQGYGPPEKYCGESECLDKLKLMYSVNRSKETT